MEFEVHSLKGGARRGTYVLNYLDDYFVDDLKLTAILNGGGTEKDVALKLGAYSRTGEIAMRKIGEMITAKNTKGIGELAGQLKDASAAIGAVRVGDFAEELEWECNNASKHRANYKHINETIKGLNESWTKTRNQFENVVKLINEDDMGDRVDYGADDSKKEDLTVQTNNLLEGDWIDEPIPKKQAIKVVPVKTVSKFEPLSPTHLRKPLKPLVPLNPMAKKSSGYEPISPTQLTVPTSPSRPAANPMVTFETLDWNPPKFSFSKFMRKKVEPPKSGTPKSGTPKFETPKFETRKFEMYDPELEQPDVEQPKFEQPKFERYTPEFETPKFEKPKFEMPKYEPPKFQPMLPLTPPVTPPPQTTAPIPPNPMQLPNPMMAPPTPSQPTVTQDIFGSSMMTPLTPTKSYNLLDFTDIDLAPSRNANKNQTCGDLLDWTERDFRQPVTQTLNLIDL